jgi:hypothetical protein
MCQDPQAGFHINVVTGHEYLGRLRAMLVTAMTLVLPV